MSAQLLIKGKAPKVAAWSAPKMKPAIALERITVALSTIHALLIDIECFQQDTYAIGQKIIRRAVKLKDPELQQHPGWNRAHWEWTQWHADQWWAAENARTAKVMIGCHANAIDCYWRDLTEVERDQVLLTVKHSAPGDGDALRQMERVRKLWIWVAVLFPVWGVDYEAVPF